MKKVLLLVFIMIVSVFTIFTQDGRRFSGSVGLAPNTMGTVGESVQFDFNLLRFLTIGFYGNHDKIYQHDIEFEKLGGPLRGDILKDIYSGSITAGGDIRLSSIRIQPYISYDGGKTDSDSLARIIEKNTSGDPYPEDTFAFIQLAESEVILGPSAGVDVSYNKNNLSLEAGGSFSPFLSSRLSGGYFQNFAAFPDPSLTDYPANANYWWRDNAYTYNTTGSQYAFGGKFGLTFQKIGVRVSGFSGYRSYTYSGTTTIDNILYYPTKLSADSDLQMVIGEETSLSKIDVSDKNVEAGISLALLFLKRAMNLSGIPAIDISYVRIIRENTFTYIDPADVVDKWIEDYGYTKFNINWGL